MESDVDVLFREFSPEERQAFLALGERVSFETDEVVLTAGSSEWDMYIIEEGVLSIWIGNACLAQMPAGQTLGTSAFLLPQIQWYAVRGDVRGTLLRIPREAAMDYFAARHARLYQQFCVNLFKSWVGKLKQRNERIVEIQQQILVAVPATGRFKLLLVDDEAEILAAMEEFFADRYDIVKALDGQEAVVQVAAARPDLILLDLRLPGLDGFEVCRQLKSRPETDHIPIVMITALTATPDKVKGRMYGADEYLTKPVDLQYLDDTVSRILAKVYG